MNLIKSQSELTIIVFSLDFEKLKEMEQCKNAIPDIFIRFTKNYNCSCKLRLTLNETH